jgi:drug/metabolite transporter (DMT)-like permease
LNTPLSSIGWMILASFFGSFGAVFLKIGAGRIQGLKSVLTNWRLVLGVAVYLFSSVLYVLGVKHGELSVLYPMVALGSVWTLLWSRLFLGEPLTRSKLLALGLILIGMTFVGLGAR